MFARASPRSNVAEATGAGQSTSPSRAGKKARRARPRHRRVFIRIEAIAIVRDDNAVIVTTRADTR
ncbi:Hypothetical protein A7982_03509 [Minicystis rosea]|nr:Hypothetical protein A7982_03509 [Minicystis rosea]